MEPVEEQLSLSHHKAKEKPKIFQIDEPLKNFKITLKNAYCIDDNHDEKEDNIPKKSSTYIPPKAPSPTIPKISLLNSNAFERKTQLDYYEDITDNIRFDKRNSEEQNRTFLRIFGRPCFSYFKQGCMRTVCEYSHRTISHVVLKIELRKLTSPDIISVFSSLCNLPKLLHSSLSPFIEIFVERKEIVNLQDQWKTVNITQDNASCYIEPFQKAFQNGGWPPSSILKRMFMTIRRIETLQTAVLDFFFLNLVNTETPDFSLLSEIIDSPKFMVTVQNMNVLIKKYRKSNPRSNNEHFDKLLFSKIMLIMEDITKAPFEVKDAITDYLQDFENGI